MQRTSRKAGGEKDQNEKRREESNCHSINQKQKRQISGSYKYRINEKLKKAKIRKTK